MHLGDSTIRGYLKVIFEKFGVHSRGR